MLKKYIFAFIYSTMVFGQNDFLLKDINPLSDEIYRYLNFNEIDTYVESANNATIPAVNIINPA